jgi:hypothetical protein
MEFVVEKFDLNNLPKRTRKRKRKEKDLINPGKELGKPKHSKQFWEKKYAQWQAKFKDKLHPKILHKQFNIYNGVIYDRDLQKVSFVENNKFYVYIDGIKYNSDLIVWIYYKKIKPIGEIKHLDGNDLNCDINNLFVETKKKYKHTPVYKPIKVEPTKVKRIINNDGFTKIDDFNYSINEAGRVRNDRTGKFLMPNFNGQGANYASVTLCKDGMKKQVYIQKIVYDYFDVKRPRQKRLNNGTKKPKEINDFLEYEKRMGYFFTEEQDFKEYLKRIAKKTNKKHN